MATVNVYLYFNGACEAAFDFYKSVFGGEYTYLGRFKDFPNPVMQIPDEWKDKILHVGLPVSKETILLGSDTMQEKSGVPLVVGNNFSVCISPETEEEGRRIFEMLSAGGNVSIPLNKTFWGSLHGRVTDKFGIDWMVDYELKEK